ncbi:MAG: hypothetical protein ACRDZO_11210 [Egibacteraceae bacterium]
MLGQLLADLAAHQHRQQRSVGWDDDPPVIEVTAVRRSRRRR